MNHPYQSARMKTWRRHKRWLYVLVSLFLLPKWLGFKLCCFLEQYTIGVRIEEFCYKLAKPLRVFVGFLKIWAGSRSWEKLWIASPVLILALIGFTVLFINANRNRGSAFDGYYKGALKAFNDQDFKKADFLFAKLIYHPSYQNNDLVLYRALIAANANRNVTRVRALREKLIEERAYEPAKRWVVENSLQTGKMEAEEAEELAIMARKMVEEAPGASYAGYWRNALARILLFQEKAAEAIALLKQDDDLDPEDWLILCQAYSSVGQAEDAKQEYRKMIAYLEVEDPEDAQFIREKVESLAGLAGLVKDAEESRQLLEKALVAVERKRQLSTDRRVYDAWLSEIRVRLFQQMLRTSDPALRAQAFAHFEKIIASEAPSYRTGEMLNGVVMLSSGYCLLSGQIVDVAVQAGGSGAQLALAMDAWVGGDAEGTRFHMGLAHAIQPASLKVIRYAATSSAKAGLGSKLDFNIFQGDNRSSYQKSLDLLELVAQVDAKQSIDVAFDRCYVYSLRENARAILEIAEPIVNQLEGKQLLQAYDWLVKAYTQLGNKKRAEEIYRTLMEEARKQRERQ